jgi:hypothetical protein
MNRQKLYFLKYSIMKILRQFTLFFLLLQGCTLFSQSPFEVVDDLSKVRSIALKWSLTENDLSSLSIRDKYTSDHNAVEHLYVQQELDGIPIDKAISGFHFKSDGNLAYAKNGFLSHLKDRIVLGSQFSKPGINAAEAVRFAAIASGNSVNGVTLKSPVTSKDGKFLFSEKSWSESDISVFLVFVQALNGSLKLAWEVPLDHPNSPDYWVYKIDAQTGKVLLKENYTLYCNHEAHAKKLPKSHNKVNSNDYQNFSLLNKGIYRVFPYYLSSPLDGQRLLLNDPSDMIASPFGWHDTNGINGAEYTITRGNNVNAYLDRDADNSPDEKTIEGGSGLLFDFPFDITKTPDNYQEAAVTQLFYMNNFMHDFTYRYGFNEEAGKRHFPHCEENFRKNQMKTGRKK